MNKRNPAPTLASLSLTNGEAAMLQGLAHFINFMIAENAAIPHNRNELNALFARYIKFDRREAMQRISDERVARGESPLPKRLLL